MPYVERRNGAVVGVYANSQPGYAEDWREDDDAEVVAFLNPPVKAPDLLPYQFWAMVEISGKRDALDAFAASLPGNQRIIAQAKLRHTLLFRRNNPLVEAARMGIGLSTEELDALWLQAASL